MPEGTQTATETNGASASGAETQTTAPTGERGESASYIQLTREDLNRQLAEARKTAEREARESQEIKDLKKKAARADELEAEKLSESERLAKAAKDAQEQRDSALAAARNAMLKGEFTTVALGKGIPADRINAAFRLADLTGVEVDFAAGSVTGIDKAVDALVKAEPYLVGTAKTAPDTNTNGSGQGISREQQVAQALAELNKRSGGDIP